MSPLEHAKSIETLKAQGWTDSAIAKHYGRTHAWVSQRRRLLRLGQEWHKAISEGLISARQAEVLADMAPVARDTMWQQLARDGKLPASHVLKAWARSQGALPHNRDLQLEAPAVVAFWRTLESDEVLGPLAHATVAWLKGRTPGTEYRARLIELLEGETRGNHG